MPVFEYNAVPSYDAQIRNGYSRRVPLIWQGQGCTHKNAVPDMKQYITCFEVYLGTICSKGGDLSVH